VVWTNNSIYGAFILGVSCAAIHLTDPIQSPGTEADIDEIHQTGAIEFVVTIDS